MTRKTEQPRPPQPQPNPSRDRLIMLVAIPLGALLLLLGQVGSRTGVIALPFDQHHVFAQLLGAALLLFGLTRWR